MRFNVDYREDSTGVLKGSKCYYLIGRVDFTEEEKAIIQQRGLYDEKIILPSGLPPPTRSGVFGSKLFQIAGIVITPIGLLGYCAASLSGGAGGSYGGGITMLILGIGLYAVGKFMQFSSVQRANPDQTLSLRQLLLNSEFKVWAPDLQAAKGFELVAREQLATLGNFIRDSASVPEQATYEL